MIVVSQSGGGVQGPPGASGPPAPAGPPRAGCPGPRPVFQRLCPHVCAPI